MATFNLTTTDLTTVNRTRVNIYERSSDVSLTPFASQTQNAPHPETVWTFDNLIPSKNYQYQWLEIDGSGLTIQTYATQNFTVPAAGSIQIKAPLDIEVGETSGLIATATSYVIPDATTWEVSTVEEVGTGTMKRGVAYSYDITTGTFTLLGTDHVFITGQRYVIHFTPKITPVSPVISGNLWSDIIIVTSQTVLTASDIGKKILLAATASILDVFLPDITLCPEGKLFYFESLRGNHINATIRSVNANNIDWLEGARTNIYIGRSENIAVYRQDTSWRIHNAYGNYATVGRMFWSYNDTDHNAVPLDGSTLNANEYVRLYQDYVSKLPSDRIVTFASWSTGNNKFKFSLANSSGLFKIPDLRGQFIISAGALGRVAGATVDTTIIPGDFQAQQMLDARHHVFADDGTGTKKPTKTNFAAWSSNHANGNQDYDVCQTNVAPSLGLTGPIVDQYGNAIAVGTKLRPDAVAARLFINT